MEKFFGPNSLLLDISDGFVYRKAQRDMAEFIASSLRRGGSSIIEAGTGVGKSLAYLIPAIIYAVEFDKKIAISTETKTLQRQLLTCDIPIAEKVLKSSNFDFSFSICLGSSNYVCKKRFANFIQRGGYIQKDAEYIEAINERIQSSTQFSRFDVSVPERIWHEICRIPEFCTNHKCSFFSSCVFQQEKKRWSESNILIMNHHLFFTNIAAEKTYLPDIDVVIFDEAHSLEDICSELLGFSINENDLPELLNDYFTLRIHEKSLKKKINSKLLKEIESRIESLKNQNELFFRDQNAKCGGKKHSIIEEKSYESYHIFFDYIHSFMESLHEISLSISEEEALLELDVYRSKAFTLFDNIRRYALLENDDFVFWADKSTNNLYGSTNIHGQPIEIASIMKEKVLSYYESLLFISATLSIDNSFNFISERLGIKEFDSVIIHSPFDYETQTLLYIPKTQTPPNSHNYIDFLSQEVLSISEITDGNCLVLFTSHSTMKLIFDTISGKTDRSLHIYGDIPASSVLKNYIHDTNSILFGTNSFWQGIDLKGDLVRAVIITKLPFSVPDKPINIARMKLIETKGKNPFFDYYVPEAIIKFKQGFGRLIRSENDFGIIAILDARIVTKSYGKFFLQSIPQCTIVTNIEELRTSYHKKKTIEYKK